MKSYYTYMLKCSDGKLYVGVTNDIRRRLSEHEMGQDPKSFTFSRRPVELVYSLKSNDINEAIAFEKQLKGWTRRKKEALIRGEFDLLPKLSKKKFD